MLFKDNPFASCGILTNSHGDTKIVIRFSVAVFSGDSMFVTHFIFVFHDETNIGAITAIVIWITINDFTFLNINECNIRIVDEFNNVVNYERNEDNSSNDW